MCDRHEKWQRVEPGTVIPEGQRYRVEYDRVANHDFTVMDSDKDADWFVDSSWKPPLVLPTEPTWGIAVHKDGSNRAGHWYASNHTLYDCDADEWVECDQVATFILLTDEQVKELRAAR